MAEKMMDENQIIEPANVQIISEPEVVKIFFDPLRRQIVQTIVDTPRTVGQIAEELGLDFRKLYYHIKLLEGHNLIKLVDRQLISGAVEEKYYQVSAYRFVIDPALLTFLPEDANSEIFAFYDLADDISNALTEPSPQLQLQRVIAKLSEEEAEDFRHRLDALIEEFAGPNPNRNGNASPHGLFTGFYRIKGK